MNEYIIQYWTTDGKLSGIRIFAMSADDAIMQVQAMPNVSSIQNWESVN